MANHERDLIPEYLFNEGKNYRAFDCGHPMRLQ